MKRDMTGGAVVMAVDGARSRRVGCPVRVVGLVAAAENAVGGNALRPGDVVRHYGGRTSEVTNTDAEGRLVLADALAYAVDELAPDVVVDVATLTGAMKVALGQQVGGFFANRRRPRRRARRRPPRRPASRCGGSRWPTSTRTSCASKVADADNAPGGPGRDHRRAVPPALRRRRALGPPRRRLGRRLARRSTTSGRPARPASAPARCWPGSAATTRWQGLGDEGR